MAKTITKRIIFLFLKIGLGILGIFVFLLAFGFIYQIIGSYRDNQNIILPGEFVDIGGRKLYLECSGEGGFTIVFESGGGGSSIVNRHIRHKLEKIVRVCGYDRAGLGWSDPSSHPVTFESQVDDLQSSLVQANVNAPYILVGTSLGGLTVRAYTQKYPDNVVGMVLVDAAEEEHVFAQSILSYLREGYEKQIQTLEIMAHFGVMRFLIRYFPENLGMPAGFPEKDLEEFGSQLSRPGYYKAVAGEIPIYSLTPINMRHAGGFGRLGSRPLVVIRHGKPFPAEQQLLENGWEEAQYRLASLSSNSEILVAENSGHTITIEDPDIVVEAIHKVLMKLQDERGESH